MKKKNIIFSIIAVFAVVSTLFFNSCENEDSVMTIKKSTEDYSKDITLEKDGNIVIMRVSSQDESLINLYSEENFELVPIPEGKDLCDMLDLVEGDSSEEDLEDFPVTSISVSFTTISETRAEDIKSVAVTFKHPDFGDERSWGYWWHYSQEGVDKTAVICDSHWWYKVYYGLKYKAYSNSSWSTVISEWTKAPNNDCKSRTKSLVYQYQFHVKARKSSVYTVDFE
jgi:hypothetical protein